MAIATTFPNGQVYTSSALSKDDLDAAMQALVTAMLGIAATDPSAPSAVRIDWQTDGQPFPNITDDVCYIQNVPVDDDYNRVRDKQGQYNDGVTVMETWSFTRVWQTTFIFYGPNGLDHARIVKSAFYLDFVTDTLAAANLFFIPDVAEPMRAPELYQGKWWERVQFAVRCNEAVTETINTPAVAMADIVIQDAFNQTAIIHNQPQNFGGGNFGGGNFGL